MKIVLTLMLTILSTGVYADADQQTSALLKCIQDPNNYDETVTPVNKFPTTEISPNEETVIK